MGWWVAELWKDDPAVLISWVVWVIGSICLHEIAHGVVAVRLGDRTPIETGHMTWNPLVHMGRASLIIFALTGIAWGLMPVNPARLRGRHGDAIVAFAGPALNLGLAALSIVAVALWSTYAGAVADPLNRNLRVFFFAGAYLNLILAAFNMLPVPPLDGSRVLASFSRPARDFYSRPESMTVGMVVMVVAIVLGREPVSAGAARAVTAAVDALRNVLP